MAKRTLLDMTQDILSSLDSDEVNSISDTAEAEQIARLIRSVYFDLVEEHDLPYNGNLIKLTSAATADHPTKLLIPENVSRIDWIKYAELSDDEPDDLSVKKYRTIHYKNPSDFVTLVNSRRQTDSNIQVVSYITSLYLNIQTDKEPNYWTSFDDEYIWFDSWSSANESTVEASNTEAFGYTTPSFSLADSFIPDLPENLFAYLYAKAKALAFAEVKQSSNPKAEQNEHWHRIRSQRNKWRRGRVNIDGPDFGRKPTGRRRWWQ